MSPHSVELWTDIIQACLEGERAAAQAVGELLSQDGSRWAVKTPLDALDTEPWRTFARE